MNRTRSLVSESIRPLPVAVPSNWQPVAGSRTHGALLGVRAYCAPPVKFRLRLGVRPERLAAARGMSQQRPLRRAGGAVSAVMTRGLAGLRAKGKRASKSGFRPQPESKPKLPLTSDNGQPGCCAGADGGPRGAAVGSLSGCSSSYPSQHPLCCAAKKAAV